MFLLVTRNTRNTSIHFHIPLPSPFRDTAGPGMFLVSGPIGGAKYTEEGAEEIAHQLTVNSALAEDPSLVISTHGCRPSIPYPHTP